MLISDVKSKQWKKDVVKKLKSFAEKSPLLISFRIGYYKDVEGFFIECNQQKEKYFFRCVYEQDPKLFIHHIKEKILFLYPRVTQTLYEERPATAEDIADQIANGATLSTAKKTIKTFYGSKTWRIDKVLPWRQTFMLCLESAIDDKGLPITIVNEQRKYQYNGSAVIYLKNYRTGQFKDSTDAGDQFFSKANLITRLPIIEDD